MFSFGRCILSLLAGASLAAPSLFAAEPDPAAGAKLGSILVYIGTYTGKKSQGIYLSRLDAATGAMSEPELAGTMINPSWVTIHPNHKFLFACGEYGPYKGGSAIAGFSIGSDGKLTAINQEPSGGGGPCHLDIDRAGRNLLVSNYGTGSVADLPIAEDGKLSPPAWVDQHPAVGAEQKPHAHCTEFDPTNHFVLSCDAGLDRIYLYRFDAKGGCFAPNDPPFAATAAGSHPRHLAFSPDGKFVYVINEASLTVTAYTYDAEHGVVQEIQTLSTLPEGFTGKGLSTAELLMHPSGKFLYGSNRGHDSIVGYSIDSQTGKLTLIGQNSTQGKTPRGVGIDPTGHWLIAGNQNSDNLVEFKIDQKTGELTATGTKFDLGAPVCFKFLEEKR